MSIVPQAAILEYLASDGPLESPKGGVAFTCPLPGTPVPVLETIAF